MLVSDNGFFGQSLPNLSDAQQEAHQKFSELTKRKFSTSMGDINGNRTIIEPERWVPYYYADTGF